MNKQQVIEQAKKTSIPNNGIKALVKKDICIMDEEWTSIHYKTEGKCLDYKKCCHPDFMLACLASREACQLGEWVPKAYSEAMGEK